MRLHTRATAKLDALAAEAIGSDACPECDRNALGRAKADRMYSVAALRSLSVHLKATSSSASLFGACRDSSVAFPTGPSGEARVNCTGTLFALCTNASRMRAVADSRRGRVRSTSQESIDCADWKPNGSTRRWWALCHRRRTEERSVE